MNRPLIGIKHVSFDFRMTLGKPDPNSNFGNERSNYFAEKYNPNNLTSDNIARIIGEINNYGDIISDATGYGFNSQQLYGLVILKLGNNTYSNEIFQNIYRDIEEIYLKNHAVAFDSSTIHVLQQIKQKWYTTSVLSNTAYALWSTLTNVMDRLGMWKYLDYKIYSDEINAYKPSQNAFEYVREKAKELHNNKISKDQILHVGDNPVADIQGAQAFWFRAFQINSNSNTIADLI